MNLALYSRFFGVGGPAMLGLIFFAPGALGWSPHLEAKIDEIFHPWTLPGTPGCAVGIFQRGEIVYAKGFGLANLEDNTPITPETVFDMGSVSKQFTATAIVLSAQRGKLSLDDEVRKFIPQLPAYARAITIRQLLHHTSGLRDYVTLLSLHGTEDEAVRDNQDALEILCRQKRLNFEPGGEHSYCNSGYMLLALIVEKVTRRPLGEFLAENVFRPLEMSSAQVHDDHAGIVPRRAIGYAGGGGEKYRIDMSNWVMTGDGAIFASINDLAKWDRNFDDLKVGGLDWRAQMLTRGQLNNGTRQDYALGLVLDRFRGLDRVHHSGSWEGYRSTYWRFPKQKTAIVLLSNLASFDPDAIALRMAETLFAEELLPDKEKKVPARLADISYPSLDEFAGRYEAFAPRFTTVISVASNQLMMQVGGPPRFPIVPVATNRFATEDGLAEVQFDRDAKNGVTGLTVIQGKDVFVHRKIAPALPPTGPFEGNFFSDELDVRYSVLTRNGQLLVRRGRAEAHLSAVKGEPNQFVGSEWWAEQIQFRRDAKSGISGFNLTVGRQKDLEFQKQ